MEIVDFTAGNMDESEAETAFTFPEFRNPLERLRAGVPLDQLRSLGGRAQEAVTKAAHKARDGATKFSLDGMQERDPYMVASTDPHHPASQQQPRREEEEGGLSHALRQSREKEMNAENSAKATDGDHDGANGDVAAALARERAKHKEELARTKEKALQQARVMEQSGIVEAKVLRTRLAEATAKMEALRKASRESELLVAEASKRAAVKAEEAAKANEKAADRGREAATLRAAVDEAVRKAAKNEVEADAWRARVDEVDWGKATLARQLEAALEDRAAAAKHAADTAQAVEAMRKLCAKRDAQLAAVAKTSASQASHLNAALDRARRAEMDLAKLRAKLAADNNAQQSPSSSSSSPSWATTTAPLPPPPPREEKPPSSPHRHRGGGGDEAEVAVISREEHEAVCDDLARLRDYDVPALRRERDEAERRATGLKRAVTVAEATRAEAVAEAAALRASTSTVGAAQGALEAEVVLLRRQVAEARSRLDDTVDSADQKLAEAARVADRKVQAARRQVLAVDAALDASQAELAVTRAHAREDIRAVEGEVGALEARVAELTAELDAARGQRAFYFSGELRAELRRLEALNEKLQRHEGTTGVEEAAAAAPENNKAENINKRASDRLFGEADLARAREAEAETCEPRTRLEYAASVLQRLGMAPRDGDGDGVEPRLAVNDVAPMLRTLLKVPHAEVVAWCTQLEPSSSSKKKTHPGRAAQLALVSLVLEARAADSAREGALQATFEAAVATREARIQALVDGLERQKADVDALKADRATTHQALDEALDGKEALEATVSSLRTRLETAAAVTQVGLDASMEHARQCVLTIVADRRGSANYNRLLPVVRTLCKQPHVVVQRNIDALCATGTARAFLEPLFETTLQPLSPEEEEHSLGLGGIHDDDP